MEIPLAEEDPLAEEEKRGKTIDSPCAEDACDAVKAP
jgi:hypothetical protein